MLPCRLAGSVLRSHFTYVLTCSGFFVPSAGVGCLYPPDRLLGDGRGGDCFDNAMCETFSHYSGNAATLFVRIPRRSWQSLRSLTAGTIPIAVISRSATCHRSTMKGESTRPSKSHMITPPRKRVNSISIESENNSRMSHRNFTLNPVPLSARQPSPAAFDLGLVIGAGVGRIVGKSFLHPGQCFTFSCRDHVRAHLYRLASSDHRRYRRNGKFRFKSGKNCVFLPSS